MSEQVAVAPPAPKRIGRIVAFWLAVLALIAGGAFFALKEPALVSEAKAAVRAMMKDPDSVEFRGAKIIYGDQVCGEFNAKNSYGAYTGFQPFYYKGSKVEIGGDPVIFATVCK